MSRTAWIIVAGATIALAIGGAKAAAANEKGCCPVKVIERDRIVVPGRDVVRTRAVVPEREVVRTRIVIPHEVMVVRIPDGDPETRAVLSRTGRTVGRAIGQGIGRTIGRMLGRGPAGRHPAGVESDLLFDLRHAEGSV